MMPLVSVKGEIYQLRLRNVESMRNIAKSATDSDDAAALRAIIWMYSMENPRKWVYLLQYMIPRNFSHSEARQIS